MRYLQVIHDYYIKYMDEEHFFNFHKAKYKYLGEIEQKDFQDLYYIYKWLNKYNSSNNSIIAKELKTMRRPTNNEIIEAINLIKKDGENLLERATNEYPKGDLRKNLIKAANKKIDCADYYLDLVSKDFFTLNETPYKMTSSI